MNRYILTFFSILFTLSAQAQRFNFNLVNCRVNKADMDYIEQVGAFEAKFYNIAFNTMINDTLPIRINLYGKESDYQKTEKDITNSTFSDGFYLPGDNEAYIFKSSRFVGTVLHESSHNMLHNNMQNPPTWLNEGIATMFGSLIVQDKNIYYNKQPYYIKILKDEIFKGKFNLRAFFNYREQDWHDKVASEYLYAVSYCLIYFFVKDDIESLQNVLTLMKHGVPTTIALGKAFGTFERFEKRFADFYKPEVGYRL